MISSTNNEHYSTEAPITDTSTEYLEASGVDVTALFKVICEAKLNSRYVDTFSLQERTKINKVLLNLLDIMIDVTDTGGASPFNE